MQWENATGFVESEMCCVMVHNGCVMVGIVAAAKFVKMYGNNIRGNGVNFLDIHS